MQLVVPMLPSPCYLEDRSHTTTEVTALRQGTQQLYHEWGDVTPIHGQDRDDEHSRGTMASDVWFLRGRLYFLRRLFQCRTACARQSAVPGGISRWRRVLVKRGASIATEIENDPCGF